MKKFGFFAFFCGLCGTVWAAASIRASSTPLSSGTTVSSPKVTASTISTTPDSGITKTTPNAANIDTNTSRIAFSSPLSKINRYYPNTGTSTTTQVHTTAKDLENLQQQIDELVQKQTQIENTLPATVQTVVKTTDLTQNTSFNEAISDLQETVVSDSAIDSKISDKLVEKGIVDNRGNLLVATSEEIQPIALSQKMESTLAVKFAKKDDVTPEKIASKIIANDNAVSTLSGKIGTNEDTVKTLIKSDLQNRGIVDTNNQLQVATKSELPIINTETVSAALQNTSVFDDMVSQNLVNKGIYDSNNELQMIKKSEITTDFLTNKLDSKYAPADDVSQLKTKVSVLQDGDENTTGSIAYKLKNSGFASASDVTPESLSSKLDNIYVRPDAITPTALSDKLTNVFITPTELSNKNFATKDDIDTEKLTQKLGESFVKPDDITPEKIASKIIANDNAVSTLSGKIGSNTTEVNNIVTTKLKEKGILNTEENLQVATKEELANLDSKFALKGEVGTDENAVKELISKDLQDRNIIDKNNNNALKVASIDTVAALQATVEKLDGADNVPDSVEYKLKNAGFAKTSDLSAAKLGATLADTFATKQSFNTLLNGDENTTDSIAYKLKAANVITDNNFDAKISAKKLATKDDLPTIDAEKVNAALANSTTLGTMIDTAISNKGYLTSSDINTLAKKSDLDIYAKSTDLNNFLKDSDLTAERLSGKLGNTYLTDNDLTKSKLSDKLSGLYASADSVSTENLTNKLGGTFAKTTDIFENGKLIATKLPSGVITTGNIEANLPNTLVRTSTLTDYAKTSDLLDENNKLKVALPDSVVTTENMNTSLTGFAKTSDIFDNNNKLIAAKLPSDVITNSNFNDIMIDKKLATTDNLPVVNENTINDALSKSTTLSGIIDDAVTNKGFLTASTLPSDIVRTSNGKIDTNILPSDVLKTGSLTGYAKTTDLLDENNKLKVALPDSVVTTEKMNTSLTSYAKTTDLLDENNKLKVALPDSVVTTEKMNTSLTSYAKTTDITETINTTLNGTGEGSFAQRLANAGAITTNNLETSGIITSSNIINKLPDTVIRSDNLPSNIITTSNLANSDIKNALTGAGFAQSSDITAMQNTLLNGDENTAGSIANKVKTAGFAKTTDVVTKDNLVSQLTNENTTNALTSIGFAKKSDVVTKDNLVSQLTSSSAKSALADAGFVTNTDISNRALTMADLSNMLSNKILVADATGAIGLNPEKTQTSVATKLSAVGNLNNMTATTNIATTVANVTITATDPSTITEATKCNEIDYMFWNSEANKCQKCPDGTEFIGGTERCKCKDILTIFDKTKGMCIEQSMDQAKCNITPNMYWNTKYSDCSTCPDGTFYKDACLCEKENHMLNIYTGECTECNPEYGLEYNEETRTCSCKNGATVNYQAWAENPKQACGSIDLAQACNSTENKYWNTKNNQCFECPENTYYKRNACLCEKENHMLNTYTGECTECNPEYGLEYNEETRTCSCKNGAALNHQMWAEDPKQACGSIDLVQTCNSTENKYWNTQENLCLACPENTYYKNGECLCEEHNHMLNTYTGKCMECISDYGLQYNDETRTCFCENSKTIDHQKWIEKPELVCGEK